jgi:hypothetical protein
MAIDTSRNIRTQFDGSAQIASSSTTNTRFNPAHGLIVGFKGYPDFFAQHHKKWGTNMANKPEYRLSVDYTIPEREQIKRRHRINGLFAVVEFPKRIHREAAFMAGKKQMDLTVQRYRVENWRRTGARATETRNSLEGRITYNGRARHGPRKPINNNTTSSSDRGTETKEARSLPQNSVNNKLKANATSDTEMDADMDRPIAPRNSNFSIINRKFNAIYHANAGTKMEFETFNSVVLPTFIPTNNTDATTDVEMTDNFEYSDESEEVETVEHLASFPPHLIPGDKMDLEVDDVDVLCEALRRTSLDGM